VLQETRHGLVLMYELLYLGYFAIKGLVVHEISEWVNLCDRDYSLSYELGYQRLVCYVGVLSCELDGKWL